MIKNIAQDTLVDFLIRIGYLRCNHFIEPIKPRHGNCCTCQKCGRFHDECVCEHNDLLEDIQRLFNEG